MGQHLVQSKDESNYSENGANNEEHRSLSVHIAHYACFCRVSGVIEDFHLFPDLLFIAITGARRDDGEIFASTIAKTNRDPLAFKVIQDFEDPAGSSHPPLFEVQKTDKYDDGNAVTEYGNTTKDQHEHVI